jgi:rRNA-processing protein FCF1
MDMAKSGIRRTVIREWMSLAREKRQSREQAAAFAKNAAQRHSLPRSRRDPQRVIMTWLSPRTGKS